ncbi:Copper-transporting ATPase PAA1, chloroplastic [Apostasia shenzhenica]|uniref:Copper-transporting ATPase PAA1, chloroplastic n=1 Tax=Apostasia shenzhenica TaxID=1088818 RepID=A0A2I0A1X1_9ASPA|nr:Copper-transporting ATPase PAA1, chloroplastic [Apostasia shenzhenica]
MFQSTSLLNSPFLFSCQTLVLSPSSFRHQFRLYKPSDAGRPSCVAGSSRPRAVDSLSMSFSGSFPWFSSLSMPSPCILACISSSESLSGSGGGGDGLAGGFSGGGDDGDGGSNGREAEASSVVGETEETLALGSDVIVLSVGGMTCGGCAASVKRILESQSLVTSATVYLEKEVAVVWLAPEAKDAENWKQHLGEKLANHLTTCGFKSNLQGNF